jgi:hypothetical protein
VCRSSARSLRPGMQDALTALESLNGRIAPSTVTVVAASTP